MMRAIVKGNIESYLDYVTRLHDENIPFVTKQRGNGKRYQSSKDEIKIGLDMSGYGHIHVTRCLLFRDRDFPVARLLATEVNFRIIEDRWDSEIRG